MKSIFHHKKFFLVLSWLFFTASLATWWWIYGLTELTRPPSSPEEIARKYNMLFWEGLILVGMIFIGGGFLLYLLFMDQRRHQRVHLFFSTFTHDIKTSISRMSLQMQVLAEKNPQISEIQKLLELHHHLDLQLENALIFTREGETPLRFENLELAQIIKMIRLEFPELKIKIDPNIHLLGDERALRMIFRNILQNSVLHGQASEIFIQAQPKSSKLISLRFRDNGQGYKGDPCLLGREPLQTSTLRSNGIGLFLVKKLCERLQGSAYFESEKDGFSSILILPGRIAPMKGAEK